MKEKISITIDRELIAEIDRVVDNIYIRNRSQAIEHLIKGSLGENRIGVILLGGDERHLMIAKNSYRPTAVVGRDSVIEKAVKKLRENGFRTIFVVARHIILTKIFEILRDGSSYGVKVEYVEEKKSNGTMDSLRLIKGKVKGNFLVVYGDIIFDKLSIEELWNQHIRQNATATIMLTTSSKPSEKGTVKVEGNKVLTFTQKPKQSDIYLVFSPIFVASDEILGMEGHKLEEDVFPKLAERGLLNGHLSSEKERHVHTVGDVRSI